MRLSAIARKLDVRPTEVMSFLEEKGVELTSGLNSRLSEQQIDWVMDEFSTPAPVEYVSKKTEPPFVEQVLEEPVQQLDNVEESLETANETVVVLQEQEIVALSSEALIEAKITDVEPTPSSPLEEIEVIRAPKLKLQGLTVMGKIELPQPKAKSVPEVVVQEDKTSAPAYSKKARYDSTQDRRRRNEDTNPLETARQRKAKQEAKLKEEKLVRQKERKKEFYNSKHASKQVSRQKSPIAAVETPTLQRVSTPPAPKNAFQKFLRWFTS